MTDVKDGKELKVEVLSGDSRFTTAVEVSKERFKDGEAEAIILVGEDAIVDGLASAPLASQKMHQYYYLKRFITIRNRI